MDSTDNTAAVARNDSEWYTAVTGCLGLIEVVYAEDIV